MDFLYFYIFKLFDGGVIEEGFLFFVFEKVEGELIDVYCERERFDLG